MRKEAVDGGSGGKEGAPPEIGKAPEAPPPSRETGDPYRDLSLSLAQLPWAEAGRLLARSPRLLLPVGALSQHGPHLPLGANTIIAEEVAGELSRRAGIPLAPTFPYGVRGRERERFAGTAGLTRKTLHRAMNELLADWEDHGVREFIVLTAHRHEPHLDALLMAMTSSASLTVVNLFTFDVSDLLDESPLQEHGGELETSLLLHLRPALVRLGEVADAESGTAPPGRYAGPGAPTPLPAFRGVLGFPSRASAEKGRAVFERYLGILLRHLGWREAPADPGSASTPHDEGDHSTGARV